MLHFPGEVKGCDPDNKTREDVIRVMDMRVSLSYKRVAAFIVDGVKRFSFSHDINIFASFLWELRPSRWTGSVVLTNW